MRGEMGRGILTSLTSLGITVECYYIINPSYDREYIVYFPKEYREAVRGHIVPPFESDPVRRYYADDPARRNFLILSSKFGIKSPEYAGFYISMGAFENYVGPITPPTLQGDSL